MLLDMQPKVLRTGEQSQQRDMEEKRALVDTMFKYLDVNKDNRLVSDELEKVSVEEEERMKMQIIHVPKGHH